MQMLVLLSLTEPFCHKSAGLGGVAVYISNTILPGVCRICDDFLLGIVFTLDGTYFMSENYICLFIYVPPDGSNWYSDETNGIEILRNTLIDIKIMYSNHKLLIAGDMNVRIGNELDYIIDENVKYLHWYNVSNFSTVRRSKDEIVNKFERTFLELCK